jgi:hypothetical protein
MDMHALCVQGLVFDGPDHYAIRNLPSGGVKVFVWHDDLDDWPVGHRWARVVTIPPLKPDPSWGGAINTAQMQIVYAEPEIRPLFEAAYAGNRRVEVRPWSEFVPPQAKHQHGVWVPDAQHDAHRAARAVRGWREWTEGLDESELDENGLVKGQRKLGRWVPPKGTRTYYHNPEAGPDIHTAANPNSFGLSPSGAATETASTNQNGLTGFSAVTPAGEPASAAWPTTGTYRYQLDSVAAGADVTFGVLNQGASGVGHFGRVNAAATADLQTIQQDQAAFAGTGLKLASITDPAWTAGSAGDRFEVVVALIRNAGHGNQDLSLQLGELDDFADGPWAAARNAPFFGANF